MPSQNAERLGDQGALCCDFSSDPAGIRTQDPYIKSVLLYQLSYGIILNFTASKHSNSRVLFYRLNAAVAVQTSIIWPFSQLFRN